MTIAAYAVGVWQMEMMKCRLAGCSVLESDPEERKRSLGTLINSSTSVESKTREPESSVNARIISLQKQLFKCLFVTWSMTKCSVVIRYLK